MQKARIFGAALPALIGFAAFAWALSAAAVSFTEFPGLNEGTGPNVITVGPDGALWYTEFGSSNIGRITTAGVVTEFPTPAGSTPYGITSGPDGALWITDQVSNKIRRMTTAGAVTEFNIPSGNTSAGIVAGRDGALWFTEQSAAQIGRITTAGAVLELPITAAPAVPVGPVGVYGYSLVTSADGAPTTITVGPDGNLWFTEKTAKIGRVNSDSSITEFNISGAAIGITSATDGGLWFVEETADKIGRLSMAGTLTEFNVPTAGSLPFGLAQGADGAIWFAEFAGNQIGRIATSGGTIAEFEVPTPNSSAYTIVNGPDNALWFTESDGNRIGRLDLTANASPLFSSTLPASRSVQVGGTATIYASMINSSTTDATGCTVSPVTPLPETFSYQTTDPTTNAKTGTANTPVNIPAGATQTFFLSFATSGAFAPQDTQLSFSCPGFQPASNFFGLNTILLSSSSTPVPDMVALVATASNDGIIHLPGTSGQGAFAVASVNVGATGAITASVDTGPAILPVTVSLCQTNPAGQCSTPVMPAVTATVNSNDTPSFAVFATATGSVPFQPASNRIFVRFKDSGGIVRGATSVAVRTQ